jgi:hypothetical protein
MEYELSKYTISYQWLHIKNVITSMCTNFYVGMELKKSIHLYDRKRN